MNTRAWILASRPKTLTAGAVPVLVGTAVAHAAGGIAFGPALAALLGALAIQVGTNFANDVFDFVRGADTEARLGPLRAVQAGLLSPRDMKLGMGVAFAVATLMGIYLVAVAGWPVVVIGVASVASGIGYTGGPFPLAYRGLGDLFVLLFFGFVAVLGTVYVQRLAVPPLAVWAAIPVGALATAVLVVNNVRDRVTDAQAQKRTLVVRWGRRFGLIEFAVCLGLAYFIPVALAAGGYGPWVMLCLASTPWAVAVFRSVLSGEGEVLNRALGETARLLLLYGVLWALGLAWATV